MFDYLLRGILLPLLVLKEEKDATQKEAREKNLEYLGISARTNTLFEEN